jgi:iron-sulfur cluster repair protein YtfE (RIC family)
MTQRNASAREQAIELLIDDHKQVKKHFREFEKLDLEQDPQAVRELVTRVCDELEVHAQVEEELFYPAAREALEKKSEADMIDEAEVEHASLKRLIAEIRAMSLQDPKFKATVTVLSEYVKHHVKEEEGEMFPQLARSRIEWEPLLQQMLERHHDLMAEKGLADASAEDVEQAMHGARSSGSRGSGRSAH